MMFIFSFLALLIFLFSTSSKRSSISLCFSIIILLSLNFPCWSLACLASDISETNEKVGQEVCMVLPVKHSSQIPRKVVITLIITCIKVAELHWENHGQGIQFLLGFLPAKNSDYFVTYTDIYVHILIYMPVYTCCCVAPLWLSKFKSLY